MTNKLIGLKGLAPFFWLPVFCWGLFFSSAAFGQDRMAINTTPAYVSVHTSAKPKQQKPKKPAKKVSSKTDTTKTEATPLDEMIVMGMASQSNTNDVSAKIAHPKIGWANFETYLRDGAVSPDRKSGLVKISFLVHEDGSCTDFKVVNSLSKAADKSAIKLIKDGPVWIGAATGEVKETTVTVNFK